MASANTPRQSVQPELINRLRQAVEGEVLADRMSLGLYATDASMFQIWPLAVVLPKHRKDAVAAMRIAAEFGAPILPRGAGTSLSGQTINKAVVIDASKYMNRLLELNVEERWARVEPGRVRDELNVLLKPHGLHFAPDPATSTRANIGGMIANNSGGMRSNRYGTVIDHLLGADLALSTGEVLNLRPLNAAAWGAKCKLRDREGEIYRGFRKIVDENREEIVARFPKVRRQSGGYRLDAFSAPLADATPWNLAKILTAAEGTLGMVLEAKLSLEPIPKHRMLCVAHFETTAKMLRATEPIVAHNPSAVELLDSLIIGLARESPLTRDRCYFIEGDPAAILIVETQGDDEAAVAEQLRGIARDLLDSGMAYAVPMVTKPEAMADVWLMRSNGLGLMTTVKGERKPVPFIEDAAVPLDHLADYIEQLTAVCEKHGRRVGIFAHAGVGLIHVRPLLDLHVPEEIGLMRRIQEDAFELCLKHKGTWSGEHGDGLVRGSFNERLFGSKIYAAFKELKNLFDPPGLMNPGHKIDTSPPEDREVLRYHPNYAMRFEETWFHYRDDGGMRQAVEQCTGTGVCRQTISGVMCPSYIATRDEEHSTRGRANALRLAMTGQMGPDGMSDPRLLEVLDLCISCKGCAGECPNNVDMAKLKSETLQHYHSKHGTTARERMLGGMGRMAHWGSGGMAGLVNGVMGLGLTRWAMDKFLGIDRRRKLPGYASQRFSEWFADRAARRNENVAQPPPAVIGVEKQTETTAGGGGATRIRKKVALFCDTWVEHFEPGVGIAAVEVLEAAGYEVELAKAGCCQRTAISKGFLEIAKRDGSATMEQLDRYAKQDIPILVLEPSCASSLADDLPDLIDDAELGKRVAAVVKPFDQFLGEQIQAGELIWPGEFKTERKLLFHGHCHHKAIFNTKITLNLLQGIPGAKASMIEAGCCGMAGSFGYEKEHYELSVRIAEDRLLPALKKADPDTTIVAGGFSCRHQIADLAGRPAKHVAEVLRESLE